MSYRLEIELDEQVAARLEAAATKERKTAEAFAVDAVVRALEDIEAWTEDENAYAEYERTSEAIPLSAMEHWVKSWGTAEELPPPKPCKSSS
jgi:hypothetical protein